MSRRATSALEPGSGDGEDGPGDAGERVEGGGTQPERGTEVRTSADLAMARYATGDAAAFAIVYDVVAPPVHRHLRRHTSTGARAEDLLQEMFLRMIRARGSFQSGAAVLPWAFAIARRLLIDSLRRDGCRDRVMLDGVSMETVAALEMLPDQRLASGEVAASISQAIQNLGRTQREAFELVRLDELSQREAAEVLGTSEAAIKALIHRATVELREALRVEGIQGP